MRILYLISEAGLGGGEILLVEHLAHADRERYQPIVVCSEEGQLTERLRSLGVKLRLLPINRYGKVLGRSVPSIPVARALAAACREERADIIHSYTMDPRHYAHAAALLSGARLVHTCQDTWSGPGFSPLQWFVMNRIPARIIATSDTVCRSLRVGEKLRPELVTVIKPGIDVQRFAPRATDPALCRSLGLPADAPVVGIVGRFSVAKGFDIFLRAAAQVASRVPQVRFLIVGGAVLRFDTFESQLHQLMGQLGLAERCVLTGFRPDVEALLGCMDVLVSASPRESFGLTLAEAAACGKPVVATCSGGAEEIVADGETGLLVPVDGVEALADGIVALLGDPARRQRMGRAARQRALGNFDIRDMARRIEAVYAAIGTGPSRQV